MSLHHFFLEEQVVGAQDSQVFPLRLSDEDARHARVLRLARGEHISVVDAASDYFECEIVDFDRDIPLVRIARRLEAPEQGPQVVMVQGIAKGDKMDEVIRHATELGVSGFVPMKSSRCVVKLDEKKAASRRARWSSIAKSAAVQCGRLDIPQVGEAMTVSQVVSAFKDATAVLVCWEECPLTQTISQALDAALAQCVSPKQDARVCVVVGPEGGLSAEEVDTLVRGCARAYPVTLGSNILRAETAGVVAPALVLYELGSLGGRA